MKRKKPLNAWQIAARQVRETGQDAFVIVNGKPIAVGYPDFLKVPASQSKRKNQSDI